MKAAVFCAAALAFVGCSKSGDTDPGATGEPVGPAPTVRPSPAPGPDHPAVVLVDDAGQQHRVYVEVVRTPAKRRRGLMYRQHLEESHGMLFIFDEMEQQSFWMKNTLIPLDMMFIDDELNIVGIVENAEPRTKTSRRVDGESIYVLEVVGGWSAKNGVVAGSAVRFENIEL